MRLRGGQFLSAFVESWVRNFAPDLSVEVWQPANSPGWRVRLTDPVVDEHCDVVVSARELASYNSRGMARALGAALAAAHRQMVARAEGALA